MKRVIAICLVLASCSFTACSLPFLPKSDDTAAIAKSKTGSEVKIETDDENLELLTRDDGTSYYVIRNGIVLCQIYIMEEDDFKKSLKSIQVITVGSVNGNAYESYIGDNRDFSFLIHIGDTGLVAQVLNAGTVSGDDVKASLQHYFIYTGDKRPAPNFEEDVTKDGEAIMEEFRNRMEKEREKYEAEMRKKQRNKESAGEK